MNNSNFHLSYRPDIDGLRAIAISSVILFHAFPSIIPGGFAGVDIFFVISGFLISTIIFKSIEKGHFSFSDFYIKRAKRIFPVLIMVLLVSLFFGFFSLYPPEYAQLSKHVASSSIFISNFILWSEAGYFDAASTTKPLLHLWSLAIEEQFYLLWPILSVMFYKLGKRFFFLIGLILIVSFFYGLYLTITDGVAAFYSPLSRFWELGIGSILSWITLKKEKPLNDLYLNASSIVGAVLIAFSFVLLDESKGFPGYLALLPTIGAALVIFGGPTAKINCLLKIKPIVGIGLISYPLYLWHWPLLTYVTSNAFVLGNGDAAKLAALLVSFLLAFLSYLLIDKPIRRSRNQKLIAIISTLLLVVIGFVGFCIYKKDGLVSRVPAELQELASITNPYRFYQFGGNIREHACHFTDSKNTLRKAECFGKDRPLLMIWGDSYAAALYPGVKALSEQYGFGITQVTAGNSPPFLFADKIAADGNSLLTNANYAIDIIERDKPDVILISWYVLGKNSVRSYQVTLDALNESINRIKGVSPNSHIIIVGPVPQWKKNLYLIILDFLKNQPLNAKLDDFMSFGLDPVSKEWDRYLAKEIPKLGVTYISAYDVLCNNSGCRIRVGGGALNLTAVDFGHLTKAGSEYLMSRVSNEVIGLMDMNTN